MAKQDILLGGIVKEEVKKVNDNFTELYGLTETIPSKTSDLTNDSNFVDEDTMNTAIEQACGGVSVPTKLSQLENDANYLKSTDTAFINKVDKEPGKELSTNDYTTEDKNKVANLGKIDFTASSFGTMQADGYVYASISAAGRYPVKVMKTDGTKSDEVLAQTSVEGDNIVICSCSAFAGYVVTI